MLKNLKIAMMLAPREVEEYQKTLKRFKEILPNEKITIFAEPWEYKIKDKNFDLIIHNEKKGCFKNFDFVVRELLKTDGDYFLVLQDDIFLGKDVLEKIKEVVKIREQDFWFISINTTQIKKYLEDEIYKNGWNANEWGWQFCPALFFFSRYWLQKIVDHEFYNNHLKNYVQNRQIDACIGETVKRLWLASYVHNPSLSIQKGRTSTIGHSGLVQKWYWKIKREKITWWIASIPARADLLIDTVKSVILQVDELYVALNWYKTVPKMLEELKKDYNIKTRITDNKKGDTEKFYWLKNCKEWYFFTFDDDLIYSPNHTKRIIEKLKEHNNKIIAGIHGARFKEDFNQYYKDREVWSFNKPNNYHVEVDVLGTGTIGFHTSLGVKTGNWRAKNMTDVHLAIWAEKNWIKRFAINHDWKQIKENSKMILVKEKSIFETNKNKDEKQTELIKWIKWTQKTEVIKTEKEFIKTFNTPDKMIKVEYLRPTSRFKRWDVGYIKEKNYKYCRGIVKKIEEKENKAILFNKNNKWL